MFYRFLYPLHHEISFFNVFKYITFRTFGAAITSVVFCMVLGAPFISYMQKKQMKQVVREDGPKSHLSKKGTPTMGGALILLGIVIPTLLWADLGNENIWIALGLTLSYGLIGYWDDYQKVIKKNPKGLAGRYKLLWQFIFGAVAAYFIFRNGVVRDLTFPFFKDYSIQLGWVAVPFAMLVIVGASNAVNFTDGLDGLATVPVMIAAATFGLIAYMVGNFRFSDYLELHFIPGAGEVAILCSAMVGSGLGFLWYNAPPARIFMGDSGALSLGGALGAIAVATKHEIVLGIVGGLFVVETVSVIIQVLWFKRTGRRVFLMAPIHHHFERLGWSESTVVIRFWIVAIMLALLGLSTLKLR